jgi:dihydroorotase
MNSTLITNAKIVNEGKVFEGDVLIKGSFIEKIGADLQNHPAKEVVDANGQWLLPGAIDDQVHFREPGLTHKGEIFTESRAAVAGGVTAYMEMPNTNPPVFTQQLLEDKYQIAAKKSLANYSFFMGTSNDNLEEVMNTDVKKVCGLKIFMGSSTGNLLVEKREALEIIFSKVKTLIATHCEDDGIIKRNLEALQATGKTLTAADHPVIRNAEGCYASSSMAVELAKKHDARLHILHISTAKELELFTNAIPMKDKRITAEACIHHLWFTEEDYAKIGRAHV